MALRSAQVFKKSVLSRLEAGGSPAAPVAPTPAAIDAPCLPGRIARIFSGRRISARWPLLLRSSTRKAPSSSSRRTAWRAAPMERPKVRAKAITALQAELADHEGMAQQIRIDGALLDAQAETWGENILKLHPEEFGVQFLGFHGQILEKRKQMRKAETKGTEADSSTTANR